MTSTPVAPEALPIDHVLGVPIHLHHDYAGWLRDRVHHGLGTHVVTLNAEMSMLAGQEVRLGETIDRAELTIPDGAGVVLYLKLKGHAIARAPGIEVSEMLLASLAGTGKAAFFFGGAPGVTDQAAAKLMQQYPGLDIIGMQHGYVSPEDMPLLSIGCGSCNRRRFWSVWVCRVRSIGSQNIDRFARMRCGLGLGQF